MIFKIRGSKKLNMDIAKERLLQERKNWRKEHPYGFFAKPFKTESGTLDIFKWDCLIPGKKGVSSSLISLYLIKILNNKPNVYL